MGGKETIRGIIIQGLICSQEIFNENYRIVKFDPSYDNTDNKKKEINKVDILLIDNDNKKHVLQVKSSINNFTKKQIERWINELIKDIEADYYVLYLVGTPSKKCRDYISKVNNNKIKNIKIKCDSLKIDSLENEIIKRAKDFMEKNNIWQSDENLDKNMQILNYILFESTLKEEALEIESLINRLLITDNSDIRDFCILVRDRLLNRVKKILEFYTKTYSLFGFGSKEAAITLNKSIKEIISIDKETENQIKEVLSYIKVEESFFHFLCNEYLEKEKKAIDIFLADLSTPQIFYHSKYKMTYHLRLRNEINKLIFSFNAIDQKISKKYCLENHYFNPFENQDDTIFRYSDDEELKKILYNLEFKEQEYPRVVSYTDDLEKRNLIDKILKGESVALLLNENFDQEKMFDTIVFENEAFTKEGSFSPQLYMRYVIFLMKVSNSIKNKLEKFKSRSTIKYIFIEETQRD
ncbi:hypothetical protein DesLBE_4620 [Desulfitobacterium sp. LBE]|uniref:hypothetical protein n=1 Tax=Desulfitobacterium sp. LBE TaxID=884086 RepID=UPI00119BBD0E|nr:hypothetical protein [Desulfitobacterium sp. LBE]TWH60200.1 hypothetical protein DesLBE_4620 [Desulfitobacterium sp. LBE]